MTDWRTQAACLDEDPERFFPHPTDREGAELAVAVCQDCPVRAQCLDAVMTLEGGSASAGRYGVWGGTTPSWRSSQRRREDRQQRRAQGVQPCPTCQRPTRPAGVRQETHPGTVLRRASGRCDTCEQARRTA